MALHWSDNVHTTAFTPRDYQVELLAAAVEKNVIICLGHNSSKEFIALKLIQELAYQIRSSKPHKVSLYLTNESTGESAYNLIYHLTDLKVCNANLDECVADWDYTFNSNQVIILSPKRCLEALKVFQLENVNVIIVEDCHKEGEHGVVRYIFEHYYRKCKEKPKVLGLAGPLHSAGCLPGHLRPELEVLENCLDSKAETASDIVTVLRYCTKPSELILQCKPLSNDAFISVLEELVMTRKAYLNDHRYDPSEIYSDEFLEELQAIPDPKKEPMEFLDNYLKILYEMGPWCADRAALHLLAQIEKQKVKTPYERHFLLLCLVSTTFVQIRSFCDYMFQKVSSDKERIEKYSSPKVLRLLEALKLFKPEVKKTELGNNEAVTKSGEPLDSVGTSKPAFSALTPESKSALDGEVQIKSLNTVNLNLEASQAVVQTECPVDTKQEESLEAIKSLPSDESCEELKTEGHRETAPNNFTQLENQDTETATENVTRIESDANRSALSAIKEPENSVQKYATGLKRPKRKFQPGSRYKSHQNANDPDALCGILFCNDKSTAKILFNLLYEASRHDPDLNFMKVQYTVDRVADPLKEAKEAEIEHRKQEEVLKRFRMHECNLLIGTAVLEEGIDLPKCNLVIRWDPPSTYRSYVQCKGRARASPAFHMILVGSNLNVRALDSEFLCDDSHHFVCTTFKTTKNAEKSGEVVESDESLSPWKCEVIPSGDVEKQNTRNYESSVREMQNSTEKMVESLAQYIEIEKMLLRKCANVEPLENEHEEADKYSESIEAYKPLAYAANGASVNLGSAIALINRYCAKLPSDTFTKLTPIWRRAQTTRRHVNLYQYTLRLPINSRLKRDILGIPMPTKVLARRVAALIACRELHRCNELDDALQPIGKEAFKAAEPDWENFDLEELDEQIVNENLEPRPGTTKRRQYYYKRIASEFSDCRPYAGASTYLYNIKMTLECPIPEEQNTRGRKIYPPEDAVQGFGIMTLKKIPKVSAFPIFTRSGEVRVSLELSNDSIVLTDEQIRRINHFLNFTFTNVLRLQKYLMLFDPEANENCFFIVPTIKIGQGIEVDWGFLDVIYNNTEKLPKPVDDDLRKSQAFDPNKFKDAVVMPWYRNQDQPQYFYVAEICYHLSPESSFPGENYSTFKEYYFRKYAITIQNAKQPLLDVDHTSARLNFLTPRYVNRKGVALPTSSEETKRAKRENLEQKQILVPELCTIHPFPASLWRAAVCLPCIIYRINALLLADEIRKQVSFDIGLGKMEIENDSFEWPILDFGWSLSEVLRKSREANTSNTSEINLTVRNGDDSEMKISKEVGDAEKNGSSEDESKKATESDGKNEKTANDLLEEADEKLKSENFIEIGTWSNDMADHIMGDDIEASDDEWGLLPPNVNLCSRNNTKIRYGSPTSWDVGPPSNHHNPINNYYSDSDASFQSDDDYDVASIDSNDDHAGPIRIEFKANNVAEAIETEEEILKHEKQLAIIQDSNANEKYYQITKNMETGFDCFLRNEQNNEILQNYERFEEEFLESIQNLRKEILISGNLVKYEMPLVLPKLEAKKVETYKDDFSTLCKLVPYMSKDELREFYAAKGVSVEDSERFKITLDDLIDINKLNVKNKPERYIIDGTGDIFDNFSDSWTLVHNNEEKSVLIDYNQTPIELNGFCNENESQTLAKKNSENTFSFDYQPDLVGHPGPSPSIILQALTMSNANDGINLERLETIGDSFLKYAITTYLYCTYEDVHEGKLSHLRSKQVSNLNLYRLGRRKVLGECMIATKFEPHDNWLPPCYYVPKELEKALIDAKIPACHWNLADLPNIKELCSEEICDLVKRKAQALGLIEDESEDAIEAAKRDGIEGADDFPCFIPYNLVTQHSIPDKSVADCVEALIGAYLIECGPRGALLFMAWLGIRVLPFKTVSSDPNAAVIPGSTRPNEDNQIIVYGEWTPPKSPLLVFSPNAYESLNLLLDGYSEFEAAIGYHFKDRAYLLQAMTHASYSPNRLSDCYQRLEFLGDAVLDYLITRHLYEDPRQHSPGALTDLRSALVNNTIFASLAVRHGFHKYFRHLSPGLNEVIDRFVRIQHENGHSISEEYYLLSEEECDDAEDVEVPKALGDVFESVAGAIFLDSNMSLDTVWKVYSNMMRPEIEQFSNSVPKSPIRELLELEPETAKFGKPEKLADGRRVRVTVEVFGKGTYRGIGRNYRIAKCTAAKCALRQLKKQGLISKKH